MALYTTDLLILGSGPAGYTAGIYAARAGLKTMIVSGNQEGGQLTMTSSIENFPGFEEISGFELMDKMKQQALKLGVQFANDNIVEVDFGNRPFVCSSENGHSYKARAVIVATGSSAKWLNIPSAKILGSFAAFAASSALFSVTEKPMRDIPVSTAKWIFAVFPAFTASFDSFSIASGWNIVSVISFSRAVLKRLGEV